MPSPFPGMDPFIEQQEWEDFHSTFNTVLREQLSARIEPQYIARVEKRVYVETPPEHGLPPRWADVAQQPVPYRRRHSAQQSRLRGDGDIQEQEVPLRHSRGRNSG